MMSIKIRAQQRASYFFDEWNGMVNRNDCEIDDNVCRTYLRVTQYCCEKLFLLFPLRSVKIDMSICICLCCVGKGELFDVRVCGLLLASLISWPKTDNIFSFFSPKKIIDDLQANYRVLIHMKNKFSSLVIAFCSVFSNNFNDIF